MAKVTLGSKQFFTLAVLSTSLIVMFFVTGVIKVPTSSQTEASGSSGWSLNDCTSITAGSQYYYGGGVKLFNGDNFTGGDRIACAPFLGFNNETFEFTDNLNKKDYSYSYAHDEVWGKFQLKTESLRLRALGGCLVKVKLFSEYNAPDHALIDTYSIDRIGKSTHTKSIELPESQDNKAKSMKLSIRCKG